VARPLKETVIGERRGGKGVESESDAGDADLWSEGNVIVRVQWL